MEQLCDALIQLHKGIPLPQLVIWHLEPFCYYVQLERSADIFKAHILKSDEFESPMSPVQSFEGSYEEIVLPFYRAYKLFSTGKFKSPHWNETNLQRVEELTKHVNDWKSQPFRTGRHASGKHS